MDKKTIYTILIITIMAISSCKTNSSKNNNFNSKKSTSEIVENHANEFLKDKKIHSVSIALFNNGENLTMHFGEQTIGKNNPPNDSTYYEIASVTKTFLGTMAAQAVLENKISLNDTITNYLKGNHSNLSYKGRPITIKNILTHTGGFPNFPSNMENKEKFLEGLKQIEITNEPGKEFHYSNTAPEITAYILEQVYNMPYQELINKYVLEPNKMHQTKFELNDKERAKLIQGYNGNNERQEHFQNNLWGGIAGLHSTTTDLLKYMRFHLNEKDSVVNESHKNFFSTRYEFDIGYHWNIVKDKHGLYYRHHGGIWGMQNWIMIYPKENIGIAVLSNSSFEGIEDKLEELANNIRIELKTQNTDRRSTSF